MSAQDKKIYKAVAYSAGGALLVHLVVFLLFAALMQAGYFNPRPPQDKAEQFEISFMEDEAAPEPEAPPEPPSDAMAIRGKEDGQKPSSFFNAEGLTDTKTPNEKAPFISDKDTKAASEAPPEEGSDSPMPTITEGQDRDLPTKDIFQQSYTDGPGQVPQPTSKPVPPAPIAEEPVKPVVEPPKPAAVEPVKPEVVEAPPKPPVVEPVKPVIVEAPPKPPVVEPVKPEIAEAPPKQEPRPEPPKPEPVALEKPPALPEPSPGEIAKVTPPAAPPAPVMPEATLPPVPELADVQNPEEKSPDPEAIAAAEKPKPPAPVKKPERETGDPRPVPPSLDPSLTPGGFKPDPEVVALLDMTPKDQPLPDPKPLVKETPPDKEKPEDPKTSAVESLMEAQARRARPPGVSAYQAERNPTRMKGGVSNKGPNSVDSQATPLGRYQAVVSKEVEKNWYRNTKAHAQDFTIGTAKLRFSVTKSGAVQSIEIVNNTSNTLFGTNCIKALQESKVPAVPDELDAYLIEGTMEVEYTFSIY